MHPLIFFLLSALILISPVRVLAQASDQIESSEEELVEENYQSILQIIESKKVYEDLSWRKLLHFEETMTSHYESQVDGPLFFIAKGGDQDYKKELLATVKAFWSTKEEVEEKAAVCRFPARYLWLKKRMKNHVVEWPDRPCSKYDRYAEALKGESVSLIFSSYYLNNPSSTFGHTFIRINKAPAANGDRYALLDYSLNFAANPDTNNPLFYAIEGAFGGFHGVYSSMPYYYKVREYANAESRDLWEYELNFTPEDVQLLIAHSWEMGPTWMNYWYLTENCSYHILSTLEAVRPDLKMMERLKKWVIPTDTLKVVWETPGLVKGFIYRPAIRTEFSTRLANLKRDEVDELEYIVDNKETSANFMARTEKSRRDILDTAIDYWDFKFSKDVQIPDSEPAKEKAKLLGQRSKIALKSEPLQVPVPGLEMPHFSHGSRRVTLGHRSAQASGNYHLFNYRFALHDQLDPIIGYPEYAEVTFWDMQFSYGEQKKKFRLENFSLMEVVSTNPSRKFFQSISYQVKLGAERWRSENCDDCNSTLLKGRAGYTLDLSPGDGKFVFVGLALALQHVGELPDNSKLFAAAGPQVRLRWRFSEQMVALAEWTQMKYSFAGAKDSAMAELGAQWSPTRNWGIRIGYQDYYYDKAAEFSLQGYY